MEIDGLLVVEYPLPIPVAVRLDALGTVEPMAVAGRSAQLHLPRLQDGGPALEWPAVLDAVVEAVTYSEDLTDELPESPWGYPNSWGNSYERTEIGVARVAIAFEATEPDADLAFVKELAKTVPRWFSDAGDWVEVLYGQDLDHQSPRRHLLLKGAGWKLWYEGAATAVRGRIHLDNERGRPLDAAQWSEIVRLADAGTSPPLPALLLRDARNALARSNRRKAVADAATALEIALYAILIDAHQASPQPDSAQVLKGAQKATLGQLVGKLDGVEAQQPGVDKALVQLRNDVVHKTAKTPTKKEAAAVVAAAEGACRAAWTSWPRNP